MRVLAFSSRRAPTCTACGRPAATHRVGGAFVGCTRDATVMQDQATVERRLRLTLIQARVSRLTLRPFGVGK